MNYKVNKMTQPEISYNQILKAASQYLVKDPELKLNDNDVYPSARLSRDL